MRSDAKASQAVLAFAKAIEATFNQGDWLALGLLTDTDDVIRGHRRLLRSLDWGDDDYSGNILEVLPRVLGARRGGRLKGAAVDCFPNLAVVEEQVGLQSWLATNDRALHNALYSGENVGLDDLDEATEPLGIPDIDMHAVRIRRGLHDDPAQAIGSAKELLETTLKAVLGLHGAGPETKLEIPKLIKRANIKLGLDAATIRGDEPGAHQRRRVLGSLAQIVSSTAELRNAGLGTGHGLSQGPVLDVATARMVVSAAVAVATFYAEAHAALQGSSTETPDFTDLPF
jgi:AbiJ N-terminal domain 5/Abortive infection C-terminus